MQTEKQRTFLIRFGYWGAILLLAFVALRYAFPLVAPFIIAFLIACLLKRPISFFKNTLRLPPTFSAIMVVILFYGVAAGLLTVLGIKATSAITALIRNLPTMYDTHARPFLVDILRNTEAALMGMGPSLVATLSEIGMQMIQSIGQLVSGLSVMIMTFVTGLASSVPVLFIKTVLTVISTFFFAIDYDRITGFCLRQMGEGGRAIFLQIKEYILGTLLVCIRSYALIVSITFVELALGLTLLRVEQSIWAAFVIALFDILPVLGTGGIMIPWAILTVFQGSLSRALGLLALYLVITVIRNILEPKIVGSQLGLHPVVTLCSMFVGVQFFGIVGLLGFPILLSLLKHLNDHGVIRLFR